MPTKSKKMQTNVPKTGAAKAKCRFHYKCTKSEDPEHAAKFQCVYQKPCHGGSECVKIEDAEHSKYFSHENIAVEGGKVAGHGKKGKKATRSGSTSKSTRRNRVKFDGSNSDRITISFEVKASGHSATVDCTGTYATRVAKGQTDEEIRAGISRTLSKRYANPSIFSDVKTEFSYKVLEEAPEALPLPQDEAEKTVEADAEKEGEKEEEVKDATPSPVMVTMGSGPGPEAKGVAVVNTAIPMVSNQNLSITAKTNALAGLGLTNIPNLGAIPNVPTPSAQ